MTGPAVSITRSGVMTTGAPTVVVSPNWLTAVAVIW